MDEPVDHSRRRAALALLGVALVAALVAGGVYWATNHNSPSTPLAAPPTTGSPVVVQPSTPTATPTPKPKPKPKPRIPHDFVGAAAPTAFTFTAKHYKIKATVCGMENVRPLDPPGEQHHTVCWVQHDFGHAPGTNGRGTTYVLGHAWGQDPLEVLNRISAPATHQLLKLKARNATRSRNGIPTYPLTVLNHDVLTLRTPNGTLQLHGARCLRSRQGAGRLRPFTDGAEHAEPRCADHLRRAASTSTTTTTSWSRRS